MRKVITALVMCAILVMVGSACMAAPAPTGKVVVTVTGAIANTNSDKGLELDLEMLEGIGLVDYSGKDPWLGNKKYTGVLLSEILKYAEADEAAVEVVVIAKDGKKVTVAVDTLKEYPIMLATKDGGKAIGSGVGGPVKLVFPHNAS